MLIVVFYSYTRYHQHPSRINALVYLINRMWSAPSGSRSFHIGLRWPTPYVNLIEEILMIIVSYLEYSLNRILDFPNVPFHVSLVLKYIFVVSPRVNQFIVLFQYLLVTFREVKDMLMCIHWKIYGNEYT